MSSRFVTKITIAVSTALLFTSSTMAQERLPLTLFMQPAVASDSVWMAEAAGLFEKEGLDVNIRLFPSGATAVQTFRVGEGDIMFLGDLPALQYWQSGAPFKIITPISRNSAGYVGVVSNDITSPEDLVGRKISTRVGSTGSFFLSEYLASHGIEDAQVEVLNLDPPVMPSALCRGDIDGFFIWQPVGLKAESICGDQVHQLTTAEGYITGYTLAGARPEFLESEEGQEKVRRFLRAVTEGARLAAEDPDTLIEAMKIKFGLDEEEMRFHISVLERPYQFDEAFFTDFCKQSAWAQRVGLATAPSDLGDWIWPDGLREMSADNVVDAPAAC